MIDLGHDFAWKHPLSRASAIAFLNPATQLESQQEQQSQQQQQPQQPQQRQQQRPSQPLQRQQVQQQLVADTGGEASPSLMDRPERQPEQQPMHPAVHQAAGSQDATQHFAIGADDLSYWPVALESHNLEADNSEDADSAASIDGSDADDAYWAHECYSAAPDRPQPNEQRPRSPSDDGELPAKRRRPG